MYAVGYCGMLTLLNWCGISRLSLSFVNYVECSYRNDIVMYFFESKVTSIRTATDDAPPPTFTDLQSQSSLCLFTPLSCGDVTNLILSAPAKQSSLDPMPTCVNLLSPYLTHLFNASLSLGCIPDLFKVAYITPLLKKPGSDVDTTENYRPLSNLPVLSKTL